MFDAAIVGDAHYSGDDIKPFMTGWLGKSHEFHFAAYGYVGQLLWYSVPMADPGCCQSLKVDRLVRREGISGWFILDMHVRVKFG